VAAIIKCLADDHKTLSRALPKANKHQPAGVASISTRALLIGGLATIGLASAVVTVAIAQTVSKEVVGELANNEGHLVDGKTS